MCHIDICRVEHDDEGGSGEGIVGTNLSASLSVMAALVALEGDSASSRLPRE